ncbi:hypothetical protein [Methylobacterium sp. ID0610]|uniref:hypothetical protein n=1 Tax=Methylobacterium carpenticola TaxID=3344827 RepID=UPI0036BCA6C6
MAKILTFPARKVAYRVPDLPTEWMLHHTYGHVGGIWLLRCTHADLPDMLWLVAASDHLNGVEALTHAPDTNGGLVSLDLMAATTLRVLELQQLQYVTGDGASA